MKNVFSLKNKKTGKVVTLIRKSSKPSRPINVRRTATTRGRRSV